MKVLSALILIFLAQLGLSQSLTIVEQDYERAKVECQRQNKMLLIDFYTSWCAPCKYLDKVIFRDSIISNEIARDFIVLKYDAEKDSTHQLTAKFHIGLFPSTVILNQSQFVVNRMYGTGGSDNELVKNYQQFLKIAIANNIKNIYVEGISGNTRLDYPQFYKDVINRVKVKNVKDSLSKYWANTSNYFGEVPFAILCYFAGGTEAVNTFFLNNKKKYEDIYGDLDVRFITAFLLSKKFDAAVGSKDRALFSSAADFAKQNYEEAEANRMINVWEERMLIGENKWVDAFKKFIVRKKAENLNDESINSFCFSAYKKCKDKKVLKKCTKLMEEICREKPGYEVLDTYSRLLLKTGDKKQAFIEMKNAIKIGKLNKDDTIESEDWLKKNY